MVKLRRSVLLSTVNQETSSTRHNDIVFFTLVHWESSAKAFKFKIRQVIQQYRIPVLISFTTNSVSEKRAPGSASITGCFLFLLRAAADDVRQRYSRFCPKRIWTWIPNLPALSIMGRIRYSDTALTWQPYTISDKAVVSSPG